MDSIDLQKENIVTLSDITSDNPSNIPSSIYFGGAGFGAAFYAGVYSAMVEKWGPDFYKHTILFGDSAGAIFSVGIALGKTPECLNEMFRTFCMNTKKEGVIGNVNLLMERGIRDMIGDDMMAYKRIENRCFIGSTSFFFKHVWQSSFESNEDLIRHMMYSCNIPIYFVKTPIMHMCKKIDGAGSFHYRDLPNANSTLCVRVVDERADVWFTARDLGIIECYKPIVGNTYDEFFNHGRESMLNWNGKFNQKVDSIVPIRMGLVFLLWITYAIDQLECIRID